MNDLAHPININRMFCAKSDGTCEMSAAELDLKHGMLIAPAPTIFEIKTDPRSNYSNPETLKLFINER
jgi:hypothetical protein